MNKKPTGVKFTPDEFRLLNKCERCGKACHISTGELCRDCFMADVPSCKMCDVLLRQGNSKFYTYDIKEDHREGEVGFKASKECVREFSYSTEFNNPFNLEGLCSECVDWQQKVKNKCVSCDMNFINSGEHYKINGNFCGNCAMKAEVQTQHDHDQETSDDGFEGESLRHSAYSHQGV